jgi:hypothetical protein
MTVEERNSDFSYTFKTEKTIDKALNLQGSTG